MSQLYWCAHVVVFATEPLARALPMVPLVLALYGHPDSGGIWETDLNSRIGKEGWKQILPDVCQSIFYYAEYNCAISSSQVQLRTWKRHGLASEEL
jgi:hypothetical protein